MSRVIIDDSRKKKGLAPDGRHCTNKTPDHAPGRIREPQTPIFRCCHDAPDHEVVGGSNQEVSDYNSKNLPGGHYDHVGRNQTVQEHLCEKQNSCVFGKGSWDGGCFCHL